MDKLVASTDAIRAYGEANAALATTVASAAAVDQSATLAAVIPVFGLIGQEFLVSFAGAQANHFASTAELAHVYAGTALAAHEAAAIHDTTEAVSGHDFLSL
ncbi:hypothetical protein LTV02_27010 [Nocardia yamanashiensis]|uniref:hypothetical protein n=1 Tax=Nocardia yamanashiensis TaxID=209247 RepID=UPI0008353D75|nr:hypothetical protein [Nocardia yamanashiensis]UGT39692.1 hypothetical protein LTV02_27010 [Nocardia yamanashiensis]